MYFDLTDEQRMLADMARELGTQNFDDATLLAVASDPVHHARLSAWKAVQELGLAAILVPVELGGSGGSVTDACIVAEALGRAAAPLPYVGSAIAVPAVLRALGADEELAAIAEGATLCPMVGRDLTWIGSTGELAWDWSPNARGLHVDAGRARTVSLEESTIVRPTYDPLHPLARVAPLEPRHAEAARADDELRRAMAIGRVGIAAFSLGLATAALDDAVSYAKDRVQYGRRIGSFQAVQHMCAEMLVDVESSRSIVLGASWVIEHRSAVQAERVGASALVWAAAAAVRVCQTSIQVLGGIGVTIEHAAHHRLRSAHHFERALGGTRAAARDLAGQKIAGVDGAPWT